MMKMMREMMPWTCTRNDIETGNVLCNGENEIAVTFTRGDPGVTSGPPDRWVQPTGPEIDLAHKSEQELLCQKCGLYMSHEDQDTAIDKFLESCDELDWDPPI